MVEWSPARGVGYEMLRCGSHAILRFLFRVFLQVEIDGLRHLPRRGPVLLLISHTNFLDGPMALALTSRMVMPMIKEQVFQIPIFGLLLRWYGGFSVRRGRVDLVALRSAFNVLNEGHVLLIAPEGTRSGDGRLRQGKPGTAFIATRADVPLVPMAVIGVEDFRSNLFQLRRTHVRMVLGRAFRLRKPDDEPVGREVLRQMTDEIMYQMARLMPPKRRGTYSDLAKATDTYIVYEPEEPELVVGKVERVPSAIGG